MIRWTSGRLVFGRMFEDWTIEDEVLPVGRVFCVASAGDTALQLAARDRDVVGVDINAAQIEYVRARASGSPARDGQVDKLLAWGRRAVGWNPAALREFCAEEDLAVQAGRWQALDTTRFRAVLRLALRYGIRGVYAAALVRGLPHPFDVVVRSRLARGFAMHVNAANPYARALLLGDAAPAPAARVELHVGDAVEFLERAPRASFAGFTLSNILDSAPKGTEERLLAAIRRAAAPGAVAVLRSFAGDDPAAARDRTHLWGSLRIEQL